MRRFLTVDLEDKEYIFEFTRKIIQRSEKEGFNLDLLRSQPLSITIKLWHVGLKKNHPSLNEEQVGLIYDSARDEGWDLDSINEQLSDMYVSFMQATPTDLAELKKPKITEI